MDRATTVSDALKRQRMLAAQAIRKATDISPQTVRHRGDQRPSHPAPQSGNALIHPGTTYEASPQQKSLNITELEEDETIHMVTTPRKFTFEPKEIAARSTMNQQRPSLADGKPSNASKFLSADIEEILASSFADNIRSMGRSLRNSVQENAFAGHQITELSLPRTADMSQMSRDSLSSLSSGVRPSLGNRSMGHPHGSAAGTEKDPWNMSQHGSDSSSWMREKINEISRMEEPSFRAAISMEAQLLEDELAWEQENAIIPELNAKQHQASPVKGVRKPQPQPQDHVELSCFSGYLAAENDDSRHHTEADAEGNEGSVCSVGYYFQKMSDDLNSMIGDRSPPQRRPLPLVDVTNESESFRSPVKAKRNSYDLENKENSLSVSFIAKAINSMDLEDSPHNFVHKLKQMQRTNSEQIVSTHEEQMKFNALPKSYSDSRATNEEPAGHNGKRQQAQASQQTLKVPNFQQLEQRHNSLSDTLSCSESMFDYSLPNTSSPKSSDIVSPASSKTSRMNPSIPSTPAMDARKKPLLDTYRVSTATKLPSVPLPLKESSQKDIFTERHFAKPNRKRRSSSATRQELDVRKRKELGVPSPMLHYRSKSPSNRAELKAVSGAIKMYQFYETPKSSQPKTHAGAFCKSHLSPEPRVINRSPFSSPGGKASVVASSASSSSHTSECGVTVPYRSASQCSGSTEWSHGSDGTPLPLKATHSELSWGSTRLRKSEKKTMQIKNTANRKLLVKAVIAGPGFQLCGTERNNMLTFQSQECRTITVDFCPTMIGPAIGALSFHPPNDLSSQRTVSLFGYGGEASVKIEGIQKGPSGPFLELGVAHNLGRPLEKSFSLYNKGSLPAFARIGIDKKGLDQALLATAVYVQPQRTIIPPNSYVHIKVVFKPRRQEIAKILQKQVDVLSITNLHILWGDEPTRHRIRRNIALARTNELHDPKMGALDAICHPFVGEQAQDGLDMFCEQVFDTIHELFLTFREYELVLTVDRAFDDTLLDLSLSEDSGTLFKTMYGSSEAATSPRYPEQDRGVSAAVFSGPIQSGSTVTGALFGGAGVLGMHRPDSGESWSVRPTVLEFRASSERTKQFVIKSNFYTAQYFELNSNYRQLLRLSPFEGHIRPGQEVVVNVSLQHLQPHGDACEQQQQPMYVVVYIENEKIHIPVKIHYRK